MSGRHVAGLATDLTRAAATDTARNTTDLAGWLARAAGHLLGRLAALTARTPGRTTNR